MPIYEYECQSCNHRFEEWQKISDKPIEYCPKCQTGRVQKLISQTSFQLKGGGWYSDLYASKKPGGGSGGGSSSGSGSSGTSSSSGAGSASSPSSSASSTDGKGKKGAAPAAA